MNAKPLWMMEDVKTIFQMGLVGGFDSSRDITGSCCLMTRSRRRMVIPPPPRRAGEATCAAQAA